MQSDMPANVGPDISNSSLPTSTTPAKQVSFRFDCRAPKTCQIFQVELEDQRTRFEISWYSILSELLSIPFRNALNLSSDITYDSINLPLTESGPSKLKIYSTFKF